MHAIALAHAASGEIEIIDVRQSEDAHMSFSVRAVLENGAYCRLTQTAVMWEAWHEGHEDHQER